VDKGASTVRLIHFTLQEYLSSHLDIFNRPHSAVAEICLTYLNSQQIKALPTAPSSDTQSTQSTPFLGYCSVYWGICAKRELSGRARLLSLGSLTGSYNQIPTKFLLAQVKHFRVYARHLTTLSPFGGLHCASFFGIVEVVAGLIEMGYDINEGDFFGRTPLAWAAHNGHEEVVKILLGREEVDPDKLDLDGHTPLSLAAWDGHEGVVRVLLEREGVNPDKPNKNGQSPLSYAACYGHEGVVKILLAREEVDPDRPDTHGQTPLSLAASGGHEGVARILLGREEVNPNKPDNDGQTLLSLATESGNGRVAALLQSGKAVNPAMV